MTSITTVINSSSVQGGTLTVGFGSIGWEVDSVNVNLVTLDPPFPGQPDGVQRELDGSATSCTYQHLIGGHRYRFSVQGCAKYDSTGSSTCSEWASIDFDVSYDNGWVPPMQKVRAIALDADRLDVFAVAADQRVWTRWWTEEARWSAWQAIEGDFSPGNAVTPVSCNPGQIDLFVVKDDGQLWTTRRTQGMTSWAQWQGIGGKFPPGNTVTPVSRDPGQIDLFVVNDNGEVWTSWWTQGSPGYVPFHLLGT